MPTFHTVYRTTNSVNGKIYIGKHSTKNPDDSYLGSGVVLKKAIEKYGRDKFNKEVIFISYDEGEALRFEDRMVRSMKSIKVPSYNLADGGVGARSGEDNPSWGRRGPDSPNYGRKYGPDFSEKVARTKRGKKRPKEAVEKMRKSLTGRKLPRHVVEKIAEANRGRKRTKESRLLMSEAIALQYKNGRVGPFTGRKHTEETKRKMSEAGKGVKKEVFTCIWCNKKIGGKANLNRWHMENCKKHPKLGEK